MELPTVHRLRDQGWLKQTYWYSLQPGAPAQIQYDDGIQLRHLQMGPEDIEAYQRTKEKLWADIHGLHAARFSTEDFRQYARYNAKTADALLRHADELDVVYIHDFQLLQVGALVGLAAPCVLRWHVPWDPKRIPPYTRRFMLSVMEDFDSVVVSTRRDLQGLLDAGFKGRVRQVYPHIEVDDWPQPPPAEVARLEEAWGLDPDDPLFLLVARMDPMKRQDLAIRAFAMIRRRNPRARLALVGNGSFSGTFARIGPQSKADAWKSNLLRLVADLRLDGSVLFTHWIPDSLLVAAYSRAHAVLLPSDIEGFGLTPLEAWRYGAVPIVSDGAGAAEVVLHGVNGLVFHAGNVDELATAMEQVLVDPALRDRCATAGRLTLPQFATEKATPHIQAVLGEAMEGFGR
jgi:glycosyltransferase involved in cell wall biosynthesis